MKKETYCLSAILGIGVALVAGAVFAPSFWQSLTGLILGVLMLSFGSIFTNKGEE